MLGRWRAGGEAVGVRLAPRGKRGGEVIRARRAVVSNASAWDTQRLLPPGAAPPAWREQALQTPRTGSFVHLHAGPHDAREALAFWARV